MSDVERKRLSEDISSEYFIHPSDELVKHTITLPTGWWVGLVMIVLTAVAATLFVCSGVCCG